VDDAYLLADIVMAATKAQGRWTATAADEDDWRDRFAGWSRRLVEDADPGNVLAAVVDGEQVIGRLRVVRGPASDRPSRQQTTSRSSSSADCRTACAAPLSVVDICTDRGWRPVGVERTLW